MQHLKKIGAKAWKKEENKYSFILNVVESIFDCVKVLNNVKTLLYNFIFSISYLFLVSYLMESDGLDRSDLNLYNTMSHVKMCTKHTRQTTAQS